MSSHTLRIHTGRYGIDRVNRNERYCNFCNTHDLEDEYHFLLICPSYNDKRKQYIKRYYYVKPRVNKFLELLNISNKNILKKPSLFYKKCSIS